MPSWFGLNWTDIIINVVVAALLPGAMAAYGGHLAAESIQDNKRSLRVKVFFWTLFGLGVVVAGWQQIRAAQGVLDSDTQQKWIEGLTATKFTAPPAPIIYTQKSDEPKAKLEFIFDAEGIKDQPTKEISLPAVSGVINLTFTVRVVGSVVPVDGTIWIRDCEECKFAADVPGFIVDKDDPQMRSTWFRILYLGVQLPKMTVPIGIPDNGKHIPVGFYYSCQNCAPIDPKTPQVLMVNISNRP
jgi:hypothetical protein